MGVDFLEAPQRRICAQNVIKTIFSKIKLKQRPQSLLSMMKPPRSNLLVITQGSLSLGDVLAAENALDY
jgi:hypothetical protein